MKKPLKKDTNILSDFTQSEDFFKRLIDSIEGYAVFMIDLDGKVKTWNLGAKKILGYSDKEIIGKDFSIFFTKDEIAKNIPKIELTYAKKNIKKINEGWRIRKGGEQFWTTGFIFPFKNREGKIVGLTKIMRDRTERKLQDDERKHLLALEQTAHAHAEAAQKELLKNQEYLKESERHYSSIVSRLAEGIFIHNLDGTIQSLNDSGAHILGIDKEASIGKKSAELLTRCIHEDGTAFPGAAFPSMLAIKTGKPQLNVVMGVYRNDESLCWILINAAPLYRDKEKKPYAIVSSFIDISDRKSLEQQKDVFIGIASHELKTPVTSLKLFSDILLKQAQKIENQSIIESSQIVKSQVEKLIKLVNDLLDMSKIQSGKLELSLQSFDLDMFIQENLKEIQHITGHHELVYKPLLKKMVIGDKDRITQVINNLISNAAKYSPGADKIIIQTSEKDGKALIEIKDFGLGIPKGEQKKVFERFFRTSDAKQKNISGFGLGLYITAEIIKRHNGEIYLKSKKGQGSTFSFTLPLEK